MKTFYSTVDDDQWRRTTFSYGVSGGQLIVRVAWDEPHIDSRQDGRTGLRDFTPDAFRARYGPDHAAVAALEIAMTEY